MRPSGVRRKFRKVTRRPGEARPAGARETGFESITPTGPQLGVTLRTVREAAGKLTKVRAFELVREI